MKPKFKIGNVIRYFVPYHESHFEYVVLEQKGATGLFYNIQNKTIYNTSLLFLEDTDYIVLGNINNMSQLEKLVLIL